MLSDYSENYATGCQKKETRKDSTIGLIVLSGGVWIFVISDCVSHFIETPCNHCPPLPPPASHVPAEVKDCAGMQPDQGW